MREGFKIVGLCILAAVAYGEVHDQITARICVQYFSRFHPDILNTENPTILALLWGFIATWWVGLIIGAALALTSRYGVEPKLSARQLVRPVLMLLGVMGIGAAITGAIGGSTRGDFAIRPPVRRSL